MAARLKTKGTKTMKQKSDGINAVREFLRAKLLAGGEDKHHAFHVARDGRVFVVNAETFYLALFAGVNDFWEIVAAVHDEGRDGYALAVEHAEAADREGRFTSIDSRCGKTYVDAVFPGDLPYTYLAVRATADDFKGEVVERKAETTKAAAANPPLCYAD